MCILCLSIIPLFICCMESSRLLPHALLVSVANGSATSPGMSSTLRSRRDDRALVGFGAWHPRWFGIRARSARYNLVEAWSDKERWLWGRQIGRLVGHALPRLFVCDCWAILCNNVWSAGASGPEVSVQTLVIVISWWIVGIVCWVNFRVDSLLRIKLS